MKKRKILNLPAWFPYPSSWLKAGILAWFLTAIAFTIDRMAIGDYYLTNLAENREFLVVLTLAILLLQVPAIALAHHLLNLFFQVILPAIGRASRNIQKISSLTSKSRLKTETTSIFPTLINWWAGLYSWLVFVLSTIIAVTIYTLLLSWFDLSYETIGVRYKHPWAIDSLELLYLWVSFGFIWITAAAILYQIEHLFKLKISDRQPILNTSNPTQLEDPSNDYENIDWKQVPIRVELNQRKKRGKFGKKTSSIDIHIKLPEAQVLSQKTPRTRANISLLDRRKTRWSNWKGWQQVLALLIISLLVGGISGVYLTQNTREPAIVAQKSPPTGSQIISPNTLEKEPLPARSNSLLQPSPIPSQTAILQPPDPFTMAVNRASNAAEMSQEANTKIEWEAVASQWQDAVELMKVVPAFHPNYGTARQKAIEYQDNANYARRVAANTPE